MKGKCKRLPQPGWFPAACGTLCKPGSVLSLQPFSDLSAHAMVLIVPVRHCLVSNISGLNAGEATTLGGQIHSYNITRACCVHTLQTPMPGEMGCPCAYTWEISYVKYIPFIKPWIFSFSKCLKLFKVPATSSALSDQDCHPICLLFWLQVRGFRLVLVKLSLCKEGVCLTLMLFLGSTLGCSRVWLVALGSAGLLFVCVCG